MRYKPQRPALKAPYPKVYLAGLLGLINVDALQTQAAGTHGTQ